MIVDVDWTRGHSPYPVEAKNIVEARNELERRPKDEEGRPKWGEFIGLLEWPGDVRTRAVVERVRLTCTSKIVLPKWPAYSEQSNAVKTSWREMRKALEEHENIHRDKFVADINRLIVDLEDLDKPTGKDVDQKIRDAHKKADDNQKEYDRATNGGRDTVDLIIPPGEKRIPSKKPKPGKQKQGTKQKGGVQPERS